jgi:hypothetical protein
MKTLLLLALAFSFVACNKEATTETAAPAVETAAPAATEAAPAEAAPAEAAPAAEGEAN